MQTHTRRETNPRDSVLARFMLGFEGDSLPDELRAYLQQGLAGVVLYPRNFHSPGHLHQLTGEIRRAAGRPVLIGIDQEGGTRFSLPQPFTAWPSPSELARLGDFELIDQMARAMAVELRAVGCNVNFAPMLDLHVNEGSPVTKGRSFGADPYRVAKFAVAFDQGLRGGRVLSCAKHFPGHGDALVDPHVDLPVFNGSMERLASTELIPFAAAIASGVPLVMTAHILLPEIDSDRPASLSPILLRGVLREHLGFREVILADDLGMGAVAKRYGPGNAAVMALLAGTDIAMLSHDWSAVAPAIQSVRTAVREERFDQAEWQASIARIDHVCMQAELPGPAMSLDVLGCEEYRGLADYIRRNLLRSIRS